MRMNEQITVNLNNLTEGEREQFKKLLEKANKENRVWKPKKIDQYYYINDFTDVCTDTWQEAGADYKRFKIGNVYKTREEVCFALERAKVKAELERYALEHNDPDYSGNDYYYIIMNTGVKDTSVLEYWKAKVEGATHFTSEKIAKDAIEAVGKERILKYLFDVDCEEKTND
jgi:ribosomal protein L21E